MLTVESCRALAAGDLSRAASAPLANQRERFEASAKAWTNRADFLERTKRDLRRSVSNG